MKDTIAWIMENKELLLSAVAATLTALAAICKLTPTPKDDGVVAKLLGWLNLIPKKQTMPVWANILVAIVLGSLGLWISYYTKKKENEKILHTAPDDPEGVADIDERERMQDSSEPHSES